MRRAARGVLLALAIGFCAPVAVAAEFVRGMNVTRLFDTPKLERGAYAAQPFGPWREQVAESELRMLRSVGFDFIRLPIDPGPLLALPEAGREAAIEQVFDFVKAARAHDLGVMLDLHTRPDNREWNAGAILQTLEGEKFGRLQELVRNLSARIAPLADKRVALELFNEPQKECRRPNGPDWTEFQIRLLRAARSGGRDTGIVVTTGCWSSVDGLVNLDLDMRADPNLYLMIHFYEPHTFTHQGASWSMPVRHIAGLDYPVDASRREATQKATSRWVDEQKGLAPDVREEARRYAARMVEGYFAKPIGRPQIEARLGLAAAWADRMGLARDRVIIGEFGVHRWAGIKLAAQPEASKKAWLQDVVSVARDLGFGWAVWGYDGAFGVVSDRPAREIEPYTLEALFGAAGKR